MTPLTLAKPFSTFNLTPHSLQEALELARLMAESDLVPKDYRGKPGNVLIAVQMGAELGLSPMQAVQNIASINGRPAVWGDAIPALIKVHPRYEWMKEWFDEPTKTAYCSMKRVGEAPYTQSFSEGDAKTAGLLAKDLWKQYPKRMLQMRARAFCARDVFPDALKGLAIAEDVMYLREKDMGPAEVVREGSTPADLNAVLRAQASGPAGDPVPAEAPVAGNADVVAPTLERVLEAIARMTEPTEVIAVQTLASQLTDPQARESAKTAYRERIAALKKTAPAADDASQERIDL